MSKRKHSKYSVCKKIPLNYKDVWGHHKIIRSTKVISQKNGRLSFYNKLVKSKQCLKIFYINITEKKFQKSFKSFAKAGSKTLDKFISYAESRLDILLFRVGFVSSLYQARQFINHGHILVNFKSSNLASSTKIHRNNVIEIHNYNTFFLLKKVIYLNIINNLFVKSTVAYIEVNYRLLDVIFLWDPDFKSVFFPIKTKYTIISRFYK
jgi:small subunit ribosomal protein S4